MSKNQPSKAKQDQVALQDKLSKLMAQRTAPVVPAAQTPAPKTSEAEPPSTGAAVAPTTDLAASSASNSEGGGETVAATTAVKAKKAKPPKAEPSGPLGKHMTFFLYPSDIAKIQTLFGTAAQAGYMLNKSQIMRLVLRASSPTILTSNRIAEIVAEDGRREE